MPIEHVGILESLETAKDRITEIQKDLAECVWTTYADQFSPSDIEWAGEYELKLANERAEKAEAEELKAQRQASKLCDNLEKTIAQRDAALDVCRMITNLVTPWTLSGSEKLFQILESKWNPILEQAKALLPKHEEKE